MTTAALAHDDGGAKTRKMIWRTFWILLAVTVFELGLGFKFAGVHEYKETLKIIFIGLTIVKAYYIIGYFMHLKHETVGFAWTICLPFALIAYFIYMMIYEGTALHVMLKMFGDLV